MSYKFIPQKKFEEITEKILCDYGISLEWGDDFKPINIDAIIEFSYELNFDIIDLTKTIGEKNVLAAICADKRTIYLNEQKTKDFNENDGMLRFTLAHELAHWVLHVDKTVLDRQIPLINNNSVNYICRSNEHDARELQADMFAAHILMPTPLIVSAFHEIEQKNHEFNWRQFYVLKEKFNVSPSALGNRLNSLELCYIPKDEKRIYKSKAEYSGQISLF